MHEVSIGKLKTPMIISLVNNGNRPLCASHRLNRNIDVSGLTITWLGSQHSL